MYHYMINSVPVMFFKIEMMAPGTVEKLFCFNVTNFHFLRNESNYSTLVTILTILINLPMLFTSLHIDAL